MSSKREWEITVNRPELAKPSEKTWPGKIIPKIKRRKTAPVVNKTFLF